MLYTYRIQIKDLRDDKEWTYVVKSCDIQRVLSQVFTKFHREVGLTYDLSYIFKIKLEEVDGGLE